MELKTVNSQFKGGISINATQGNLMERSEVVIIFTLIMANLLTKQDLHLELEHKEQVRVTT
jgi:hypothetical protein